MTFIFFPRAFSRSVAATPDMTAPSLESLAPCQTHYSVLLVERSPVYLALLHWHSVGDVEVEQEGVMGVGGEKSGKDRRRSKREEIEEEAEREGRE